MAKRQKRTTILDIANVAGVSTATVSRVLSNVDYPVSETLRQKIHDVAEKLGYRPNIFSQVLKGGVNKVIGVIVPSLTNPFYAQLVADVERYCVAKGYAPIICSSYDSPALEQEHMELFLRQQVAGILMSTINNSAAFLRKLNAISVPSVLFDQPLSGFKGHSVVFDFRSGGQMATQHLIDRGHRRMVYASRPVDRTSRKLYRQGCIDALRKNGLAADNLLIVTPSEGAAFSGKGEFGHGRILAEKLLRQKTLPDAVVASNDIIAIGMLNALRENGVRVPQDVSIIGFDDIDFAAVMTPGLTTIRQSTARTAELAIHLLLSGMDTPGTPPANHILEPELIERESVACIETNDKGEFHDAHAF